MRHLLRTLAPIIALASCDHATPNVPAGTIAARLQPGIDTCLLFASGKGFDPSPLIAALYLPDVAAQTPVVFRPAEASDDGSATFVTYSGEFSTCKITHVPAARSVNLSAILRSTLRLHGYEPSGQSHGASLFSKNGETIRVIASTVTRGTNKELSLTFLR